MNRSVSKARHKITPMLTLALALFGAHVPASAAESRQVLSFETHAGFFSHETHQKADLDPQVFVKDAIANGGVGPQQITHVNGIRNALVADNPDLPIFSASGQDLGMTLGKWLGAKGEVILTPLDNGKEKVTIYMTGLKPHGKYSFFENHFDQKPIGFTPLDGAGTDNTVIANAAGAAVFTTIAPSLITHDNAVLVVYQSDGKSYGKSRGEIGHNAHHQLIARP